jgi:murein DD-endopeptidase MepM/ murein hydrolase activator NlpD
MPMRTALWKKLACLSVAATAAGLVCGILFFLPGQQATFRADGIGGPAEDIPDQLPASLDATSPLLPPLDAILDGSPVAGDAEAERTTVLTIGRSQTFYEALRGAGAPHEDIMALVAACKPYRNLKRVRRGDLFELAQHTDGGIRKLSFDLDLESYLSFIRDGDGYEVQELTHPVQRHICAVSGSIQTSLYASLKSAGAPLSLAPKINDILGWEIDFSRDLRRGDTFRILYEEIWKEGEFVRTGPILAIDCLNRKQSHQAYRFVNPNGRPGYYDPDGHNLQKQLLRAPLEYSRISSGFSWRRFHPVLKRYMPHLGVDYAAPVGTPVRAGGSGIVVTASRKEGNGRYIQIRHNNRAYESYYLHLSRLAKGIKKGVTVRQGDIIGYVGATGYATGPHLDYRVKKDGVFVDPRSLKLPAAEPVAAASLPEFRTLAELYRGTLLAMAPISAPHQVALAHTASPPLWHPLDRPEILVAAPTAAPGPGR